jgi:hypothetical protein
MFTINPEMILPVYQIVIKLVRIAKLDTNLHTFSKSPLKKNLSGFVMNNFNAAYNKDSINYVRRFVSMFKKSFIANVSFDNIELEFGKTVLKINTLEILPDSSYLYC